LCERGGGSEGGADAKVQPKTKRGRERRVDQEREGEEGGIAREFERKEGRKGRGHGERESERERKVYCQSIDD
jgi:hypothetical protein